MVEGGTGEAGDGGGARGQEGRGHGTGGVMHECETGSIVHRLSPIVYRPAGNLKSTRTPQNQNWNWNWNCGSPRMGKVCGAGGRALGGSA